MMSYECLCRSLYRAEKDSVGRMFFFALFMIVFYLGTGTGNFKVSAAEPGQRTVVKAGFFENGDFMHKDADGEYEGYDIDYYYTIAGYAGWKIEFVEYEGVNDAVAALKRGDIQVLSGLTETKARDKEFLVSEQKMCTSGLAVQVRADEDRFDVSDITSMENMTCGVLKGSSVEQQYRQWCILNGLTPHITEYDSITQRNEAFYAKETDAIVAGSTIENAQKLAEVSSVDLYFMFHWGETQLKNSLDSAMRILALENPDYTLHLKEKYFPATRNAKPSFTAAEKKYIQENPVVRIAVPVKDEPFCQKEGDTVTGILPEYYAHLGELTGLTFECVPFTSKEEACDALINGKIDVAGVFEYDSYRAHNLNVILSQPYLQISMVQLTRAGTDRISTVAMPEPYQEFVSEILLGQNSKAKIKVYAYSDECFAALKSGETDAVLCTQPAATWLLNRNRASDYVLSGFGGNETWNVSFAFGYGGKGNTLRSVLNKSILADQGYIDQLVSSDILQDSADLAGLFDRLPVSIVAAMAGMAMALLVIVTAALLIIVRRRQIERKLAAQQVALTTAMEETRARHAFFGAISHDMRTPLNGIIGFTDLALKSADLRQIMDYLQKIHRSANVLSRLVSDTLIMSRMENGQYILHPEECNMKELLEEIAEPVREMAMEKEVSFRVQIEDSADHYVYADRLSLQRILLNLLSNAVKFTPNGGYVALDYQSEKDGKESVITVSDNGIGMSREFLPHAFEMLAQENPTSVSMVGSGMGLPVVKSIVDAMGGTVEVSSRKGSGTTFTVRLNLEERKGSSDTQKEMPEEENLSGRHILVCEDNELNLEIIRQILEMQKITVTVAENGKAGVQAFKQSAPYFYDLILMDLRMPVMDGKTAAHTIRMLQRADAADIPILAVSADAYQENVDESIEAGMNGHISKPVDAVKLIHTIFKFIQSYDKIRQEQKNEKT
ncbi:MAG: transporter substrate-binding domain-containing protein [Butyrivibrio sp.]|nr:transporter substrate-binding domain-containing protein [Butyrivibrio sp.]